METENNNKQNNKSNQTSFDEGYFNTLISNNQYRQAVNYGRQFILSGENAAERNRTYFASLRTLEDIGYVTEAQYSRMTPADTEVVDVANNYKYLSSLYELNDETTGKHNQLAQNIQEKVYNLGGENATSMSISFYPERRTFLGVDFLAADNSLTVDKFYEFGEFDEETLSKYGVEITHERDGRTTFKFDKNNEKVLDILNAVPLMQSSVIPFVKNTPTNEIHWNTYNSPNMYETVAVQPFGFEDGSQYPIIQFYTKDGTRIEDNTEDNINNKKTIYNYIRNIRNIGTSKALAMPKLSSYTYETKRVYEQIANIKKDIQNAIETKKNYFNKFSEELHEYPSTMVAFGNDYEQQIEANFQSGLITADEYRKQLNDINDEFRTISTAIGDRELYSITLDDKGNIRALVPITDNETRNAIIEDLQSAMRDGTGNRMRQGLMISNDKVGAFFSLLPKEKENKGELTDIQHPQNGEKTYRTRHIFIPGLFSEKVQQQILNDPKYRAERAIVNMDMYNYSYPLLDGTSVEPVGNGTYKIGNNIVDKQTAINAIYKKTAIQDVRDNLIPQHLNANGQFIRPNDYVNSVIKYMFGKNGMVQRLYPQYNITTDVGMDANNNAALNIVIQLGDQFYNYSVANILKGTIDYTNVSDEEKRVMLDIQDIFKQMTLPISTLTNTQQ